MSTPVVTIGDMAKRKSPAKNGEKKKPNRTGRPIMVWVPDDVFAALGKFSAAQKFKPTLTDMVELALREFLKAEGFPPGGVAKP
jgi:hypothetical protein